MSLDPHHLSCDAAQQSFSDHLDDAMVPEDRAALDNHLESCADCRADYDSLREAVAALHDFKPRAVPASLLGSIRVQCPPIEPPMASSSRRLRDIVPWLISAAAIVVALLSFIHASRVESHVRVENTVDSGQIASIPPTVSVPVAEGELRVVRGGEVLHIRAGQDVSLQAGDRLLAPKVHQVSISLPEVPSPRPQVHVHLDTQAVASLVLSQQPVREPKVIHVDTAPLVAAMHATYQSVADTLSDWSHRWENRRPVESPRLEETIPEPFVADHQPSPSVPTRIPRTHQPITLVRDANGGVQLRTHGPWTRVVPSLLSLLHDGDPGVAAAAEGHLMTIFMQAQESRGLSMDTPLAISNWESWWRLNRDFLVTLGP